MYKHLLVPLDGSTHAQAAQQYAVSLAKRFGADLHGLHIMDLKMLQWPLLSEFSASLGMVPNVDLEVPMRELLRRYGETVLEAFRKVCEEQGVTHRESLVEGLVSGEICEAAKLVDLVVMGERGQNADLGGELLGSNLEAVARACGRPVLVTSNDFEPFRGALIGYDGSRAAASALETGAHFAQVLEIPLTILSVSADKERSEGLLREAAEYLHPYGVPFETEWREGDTADQICTCAAARDANLIILGAYGHTRLRHLLLGSTTEEVLRKASVPVLMHR